MANTAPATGEEDGVGVGVGEGVWLDDVDGVAEVDGEEVIDVVALAVGVADTVGNGEGTERRSKLSAQTVLDVPDEAGAPTMSRRP